MSAASDPAGPAPAGPAQADLAVTWARALHATGSLPMALDEAARLTERLSEVVVPAVIGRVATTAAAERVGRRVGRELVEAHVTGVDAMQRTLRVLGDRLPVMLDGRGGPSAARRITALQAAVAAGFTTALQSLVLQQQEEMRLAVLAARDQAEAAMRVSDARFRALFTEAAVGIGIGDVDGNIIEVNPALIAMLGYDLAEFRRRNVAEFMHPQDAATVWQDYQNLVSGRRESFHTEKRFFRSDGVALWTDLTVSLIRGDDGRPLYQVAIIQDVTAHHELREQLRHEATHDPLTGLPNRSLFLERLGAALVEPRPDRRVGLCFLDLDSFKMINDSLGHTVGDQLLAAVADRFRPAAATAGGLLARLAGDEFVVFLEDSPGPDQVVELAGDLVAALHEPIPVAGHRVSVSTSIGVVEQPAADTTAADLLRAADLTLHWAKADGKGRAVVHDPTRNAHQLTRYALATSLPGALDRGEFGLVYQPLIRLPDGHLHGWEALLRWHHPQFGELTPDHFVAIAEETGAILSLGRWALRRACRQAAAWRFSNPGDALVSVNVAVRQLQEPDIVDQIAGILEEAGLPAQHLQLEVTESAVMTPEATGPLAALRALADMGIRIAVDDFGTGYSNLAALRRLPLHTLKLAGTFLAGLRSAGQPDPVDLEIIATLVRLAHTLGLTVTAEGVETLSQDERIREIGCDVGQGWFYARPAEAAAIPPRALVPERAVDAEGWGKGS